MIPQYMRGVALAVQKRLLRLWFSPEYVKYNLSVSNLVFDVDENLKHMRPTLHISWLPKSVSIGKLQSLDLFGYLTEQSSRKVFLTQKDLATILLLVNLLKFG